ncbi:MAG: type II secretory pathway pseudopilin PulG [Planctomycetota bacterium]|jgi:type II secretory pathway pseudopilin PulG
MKFLKQSTRSSWVHRRRCQPRASTGFTLVEVIVGGSVLVTAVLLTMGSILSSIGANAITRESAVASAAAQTMLEELRQEEFTDLFVLYNADPSDDPNGSGTAPGNSFDVDGLTARAGDLDGAVGEIIFPATDVSPAVLRENLDDPFGSLDLSGDGVVDGLDHSEDYVLLPVQINVIWSGAGGDGETQLITLVANL